MNRRFLLLLGVLFLPAAYPEARASEDCKLVRVAEWPIRWDRGRPLVDGSINGTRVNILLHTAAYASLVTKEAATRLGLSVSGRLGEVTNDNRGGTSDVGVARLDELRIGTTTARNLSVRVAIDRPVPGVDFILGADFFSKYDIEFDYAGGAIRIFEARRCVGGNLAYWDPKARRVGLERGTEIVVPVKVNGTASYARLDTSSNNSLVASGLAAKVGHDPGSLPAGCLAMARFDSIDIGDQVTRDANLYVAAPRRLARAFVPGPDVTLGNDFLRRHRVLVARSQATLYFSYLGGQVFTAVPIGPCDDRIRGKSDQEALAALDAAIEKNPRDAGALLGRAEVRARNDPAGAVADLDAVVALEPASTIAYTFRSNLRSVLKDYAGALADSDMALRLGAVNAATFAGRGRLHRLLGDPEAAQREYEMALRLDPREPIALRERGRYRYHQGRYAEAETDFRDWVSVRSQGYSSVWLFLALVRQGKDGKPTLEDGRARLTTGEWPAPILDLYLGKADYAAVMSAAQDRDPKVRAERECEARFYAAARLGQEGKATEARPLLEKAVEECPRNLIEYDSAAIELKAGLGRGS